MIVYRFQNTKELETQSYSEDIMNIYLNYKENFEEKGLTDDLLSLICEEWQPFIDQRQITPEFEALTEREWIEKILSFSSEEEAWEFQMQHKLFGVFAIEPTDTLEEAFRRSVAPEMGLGNKYLIVAEADVLECFSHPFGILVDIQEILEVHKTPREYLKSFDMKEALV